jgi:hypothetical protein
MANGKKKATRFHSRWRVDQDYLQKLGPAERDWIEKFNDEYYRAEFKGEPLHPAGPLRRQIFRAQNAAAVDLVTAATTEVTKAMTTKVSDRPSLRVRFYVAEDYRMLAKPLKAAQLEDELLEALADDQEPKDLPPHSNQK